MVRIAIVEHDASVSARLHELLEIWQSRNFVPMSVLEYNDELEFISAYPSPLDMVLLSVEQPHMGGMEIVRRIRHFDRDVRIVLLSEGCDAAPPGRAGGGERVPARPAWKALIRSPLDY